MKAFFQKLGWYLTFFFLGVGVAFYIAAKHIGFDSTEVDVIIKKLKNKRVKGDPNTSIPVNIDMTEEKPEKKKRGRKLAKKEH